MKVQEKRILWASSDVLKAVAEGKFPDRKFAKRVEKSHKDDIEVLRNLDKAAWCVMRARKAR